MNNFVFWVEMFQIGGWISLFLTSSVSGELLGVKCLYNLEAHCQDVNGL